MLYTLLLQWLPARLACIVWVASYSLLIILIILLADTEDAVFRYMQ